MAIDEVLYSPCPGHIGRVCYRWDAFFSFGGKVVTGANDTRQEHVISFSAIDMPAAPLLPPWMACLHTSGGLNQIELSSCRLEPAGNRRGQVRRRGRGRMEPAVNGEGGGASGGGDRVRC